MNENQIDILISWCSKREIRVKMKVFKDKHEIRVKMKVFKDRLLCYWILCLGVVSKIYCY